MSDDVLAVDAAPAAATAGTMLREARQAQGLHIAALAASIKVSQRKLELLEADRIAELPDATFARALAQTVCRSLKIDPVPVLAALPQASGYRLEGGSEGINKPFRDKPGRRKESSEFSVWGSPALWAPVLIVLAAAGLYFMPARWVASLQSAIAAAPASTTVAEVPSSVAANAEQAASASATVAAAVAPPEALPIDLMPADLAASGATAPLPELVLTNAPSAFAVPAQAPGADATSGATPAAALNATPASVETVHSTPDTIAIVEAAASGVAVGPLQVKATEESWVEVVDAKSQVLVSRMLQRGETVVLNGAMPFKLKLGNAAGVTVALRGAAVDLTPSTRGNVARLELK